MFHDGDSLDTLSVNLETGVWQCFARCGGGNYMDLVDRLMRGREYAPISSAAEESASASEDTPSPRVPILRSWLRRGFTREICAGWGIAWDAEHYAMRLPVIQGDGTETALWRAPEGVQPKYRYPPGFSRATTLYGLWRLPAELQRVILVEGPLDAIWGQQAGEPAVAILGSSLSDEQIELLCQRHTRQAVLCFDQDEAGRRAAKDAIGRLRTAGIWVYRARLPKGKKDIQDVALDRVAQVLTERVELCANGSGIIGQRMRRWLPR